MVEQVLDYLNNYFINTNHNIISVNTETNTVTTDLTEYLAVGQYVLIWKTLVDDGVYKIIDKVDNTITLDSPISSDLSFGSLYGLRIPKSVLEIVGKVEEYEAERVVGVKSENILGYSITYTDNNSWQTTYKDELKKYRKVYKVMP